MTQCNARLRIKLDRLEGLTHKELSLEWIGLNGRPPPKASSRKFLARALSYELQAKVLAPLSKADQKTLDAALQTSSKIARKTKAKCARPALKLDPGAKLVREWNGKTHLVSVIEEGFVYKNKVWGSLSAIAKYITGAHWSGPRFFGLTGPQA